MYIQEKVVQNGILVVTGIQRLAREGGASKRDGERIASTVGGKLEKAGFMETRRKKCFRKEVCTTAERYSKRTTEKRNGHYLRLLKVRHDLDQDDRETVITFVS